MVLDKGDNQMDNNSNIVNMQTKLKLIRQVFDISITSFADMVGVTRQTIYNIENNKTVLTKTQYLALCQVTRSLLNKHPDKYVIVKSIWESEHSLSLEEALSDVGEDECR